MIANIITKNGTKLLKTGTMVLLSTLANQALRESSKETIENLTKDIRKVRYAYETRHNIEN